MTWAFSSANELFNHSKAIPAPKIAPTMPPRADFRPAAPVARAAAEDATDPAAEAALEDATDEVKEVAEVAMDVAEVGMEADVLVATAAVEPVDVAILRVVRTDAREPVLGLAPPSAPPNGMLLTALLNESDAVSANGVWIVAAVWEESPRPGFDAGAVSTRVVPTAGMVMGVNVETATHGCCCEKVSDCLSRPALG